MTRLNIIGSAIVAAICAVVMGLSINHLATSDDTPPTDTVPIGHVAAANVAWGNLTHVQQADACDQYNNLPRAELISTLTGQMTDLPPLEALALAAAFHTVLADNCP